MFGLTQFGKKHNELVRNNHSWDMRTVFDEFFNHSFNDSFFSMMPTHRAGIKADIRETEKEYIIDAELPGVKKEDVKLELKNDVLSIAVEKKEEINEEGPNYIRKERRTGAISRSFYVDGVKNEEVTAKYKDGILTITLPKHENGKSNNHRIEIQ